MYNTDNGTTFTSFEKFKVTTSGVFAKNGGIEAGAIIKGVIFYEV